MPTVPTQFVPQVAPPSGAEIGQFQAPGVQPAENLAAPQLARFGNAMTAAGNAAFRLGSALQDGIDEAQTRQADVEAGRGMMSVSDEYLATQGSQSEGSYEAAMARLSQAGAAAMDRLQNDTQRRMFAPILARNMGMFQSRMTQHRNGQVRVWNTNEAIARSEVEADKAIFAWADRNQVDAQGRPVGMLRYAAHADTAVAEARKAGELMGYAPESAQMTQLEQKVYDRMAAGIVNGMMEQGQYADADAFLSDPSTAETLDAKRMQALRSAVDSNKQRAVISELTDSIKNTGVIYAKSDPKTYGQEAGKDTEPPATLREALDRAEGIEDADVRKAVQAQLRTQYAQDDALVTQEYNTLLDNVDDFVAVPGNTIYQLPPDQFARLTPRDQQKYLMGQRQRDEDTVMQQVTANPQLVATDWLEQNRFRMTPQTYNKLRAQRDQPEKIQAASIDAAEVTRQLYDFGMDKYADPGRDANAARATLILRQNIEQRIDARQRAAGRVLKPEEKREIIKDSILDEAYIEAFGRDPKKPIAMMTKTELESAYVVVGGKEVPYVDYVTQTEFVEVRGQRVSRRQYDIAVAALQNAGGMATPEAVLMYWEGKGRPK